MNLRMMWRGGLVALLVGVMGSVVGQVETAVAGVKAALPFQVRVEGAGKPMILIPGLTCDGTVWNQAVAHFRSRYQCHVVSLAGFGGVPPVVGAFVPTMRDGLVQYIRTNKLDHPVIVGHSLGGYLALAVAVQAPQEVGPIVVVDGAPALGALMSPGASAQQIATQSAAMRDAMGAVPQQAFAEQNRMMMTRLVTDAKTADALAGIAGKSDVKTVAAAMYELMTSDLREAVARITSPVLLIGAGEMAKDDAAKTAIRARYEQQVAKIPNHKVAMVYDSRHFVMLDQPETFYRLVGDFLK